MPLIPALRQIYKVSFSQGYTENSRLKKDKETKQTKTKEGERLFSNSKTLAVFAKDQGSGFSSQNPYGSPETSVTPVSRDLMSASGFWGTRQMYLQPLAHIYKINLRKLIEGWRNGSVVKSIDCSSRGPEFSSQQP